MAQKHRVKAFLEEGNTLTSITGLNELGIIDVPKRISELSQDGFKVKKSWLRVVNRYGEKTQVRIYYL